PGFDVSAADARHVRLRSSPPRRPSDLVAIARAMAHEPRVMILDEPTSSLSSEEAARLFALIDRLRNRGVAILYISHRMSDIRRRSEEHTSELQSRENLVCRLLLQKKKP